MGFTNEARISMTIEEVRTTLAVEGIIMQKLSVQCGEKFLHGQISSNQAIQVITEYIMQKCENE